MTTHSAPAVVLSAADAIVPELPTSLRPALAAALADGLSSAPAGGSIPLWSDDLPSHGYVVGGVVPSLVLPSPEVMTWWDRTDYDLVLRWLEDWAVALSPADVLGWWTNSDTQRAYVDACTVVPTLQLALELGRSRGELAIWSIHDQREYRTRSAALV